MVLRHLLDTADRCFRINFSSCLITGAVEQFERIIMLAEIKGSRDLFGITLRWPCSLISLSRLRCDLWMKRSFRCMSWNWARSWLLQQNMFEVAIMGWSGGLQVLHFKTVIERLKYCKGFLKDLCRIVRVLVPRIIIFHDASQLICKYVRIQD